MNRPTAADNAPPHPSFKRAWERYKRDCPDNLARHMAEPEMLVDAYVKAQNARLGEIVSRKRRIYLDTKYWLYCLDALSGKPQRPIHIEIANALVGLVDAGNTICPAHYALFVELGAVGNPSRRRELAKLIDWLSGKITIVPPHVQQQSELLHLIRSLSTPGADLHPVKVMVWRPISSVLGTAIPSTSAFPPDVDAALQKDWVDFIAYFGLEDLLAMSDDTIPSRADTETDLHHRQNEGTARHRHDYKTFHEAFLIEVEGTLDAMRPMIGSAFRHLFVSAGGRLTDEDLKSTSSDLHVRQFCGIVWEAYRQTKLSTQWPSLHIGAGIHAAIRYERRKYKKGDLQDHLHAQAALPYCGMFLTERVLGTLITGKYLGFDEQYSCKVLWCDQDVLRELKELPA